LKKSSKKLNPHHDFPLRKIVRRELQDGKPAVLMVCGHTVLGRPESRYSRFYPCSHCYEVVVRLRAEQASVAVRVQSPLHDVSFTSPERSLG
jgi:hypothetical protein